MTLFRTVAPALALVLLVAYSIIATMSSGELTAVASPMLIAAIALAVWHDRSGENAAA